MEEVVVFARYEEPAGSEVWFSSVIVCTCVYAVCAAMSYVICHGD